MHYISYMPVIDCRPQIDITIEYKVQDKTCTMHASEILCWDLDVLSQIVILDESAKGQPYVQISPMP